MSKKRNSSILNYLTKIPRLETEPVAEQKSCNSANITETTSGQLNNDAVLNSANITETTSGQLNNDAVLNSFGNSIDVKNFVKDNNLSNRERLDIMEKLWHPQASFNFPQSGKRNLRFQHKWLGRFEWLAYSQEEDGAYCKYCVLFLNCAQTSKEVGLGQHQSTGQLISMPFKNWKKALDKFSEHQNCTYHKKCMELPSLLRTTGVNNPIHHQLNEKAKKEVEENRSKLIPIIETIIICGKQNIALRGHRDSGQVMSKEPIENDGNFRALLRYRARTDDSLRNHLDNCKKNAMYTSWKIQNEIIETCNELIRDKIVQEVNESRFFSILADETTDISTAEQMNLCVRYVDMQICSVKEMFLQFVIAKDLSGQGIAEQILSELTSYGIDLTKLRGQGYDGASAMSAKVKGVSTRIQEIYPSALYVHCASHSLNLAVGSSCEVTHIRNCMGTINTLCEFFHTPKRQNELHTSIQEMCPEAQREKLKRMCLTRWTEHYNSVASVVELLPAIMNALENMSEDHDALTSATAAQLMCAIKQDTFIISLFVLYKVFSVSYYLCKLLQERNLDLAKAVELANDTINEMKQLRNTADVSFHKIFEKTKAVADEYGFILKLPRITSRQTQRLNVKCENPESYYRISIFIPFLDAFVSALEYRFIKHNNILSNFQVLFPKNPKNQPSEDDLKKFKSLTKFYSKDLVNTEDELSAELNFWYRRLSRVEMSALPKNALNGLKLCQDDILPNIKTLLHLLATLPVTTCESERTFSTLRRLKTYLRNSMGENRLNGLALLNIHREYTPSAEDVLRELIKKSRRLDLKID